MSTFNAAMNCFSILVLGFTQDSVLGRTIDLLYSRSCAHVPATSRRGEFWFLLQLLLDPLASSVGEKAQTPSETESGGGSLKLEGYSVAG